MKKLPTFTKIIYGFGDIGFSMTGTIIAAYFPIFLTDVIGIAPAVAAIGSAGWRDHLRYFLSFES